MNLISTYLDLSFFFSLNQFNITVWNEFWKSSKRFKSKVLLYIVSKENLGTKNSSSLWWINVILIMFMEHISPNLREMVEYRIFVSMTPGKYAFKCICNKTKHFACFICTPYANYLINNIIPFFRKQTNLFWMIARFWE